MEIKIIYGAAMFLVGWLWFYLFFRQFLYNFCTAFPLIKAMNTASEGLIGEGAKKYTIVSVATCTVICAIVVAIIVWLCPLYLILCFFGGALVGILTHLNKLSPSNRQMFDSFCSAYYRFVPDDELRTAMYNRDIPRMKRRLNLMTVSTKFIPEFK